VVPWSFTCCLAPRSCLAIGAISGRREQQKLRRREVIWDHAAIAGARHCTRLLVFLPWLFSLLWVVVGSSSTGRKYSVAVAEKWQSDCTTSTCLGNFPQCKEQERHAVSVCTFFSPMALPASETDRNRFSLHRELSFCVLSLPKRSTAFLRASTHS
jgi:hypothetical protein